MEICHYDSSVSPELLERFVENRLIFGIGRQYGSLISPSSTIVNAEEARELEDDLGHLWTLYRRLTDLYLGSLAGSQPDWIRGFTEYDLTGNEIRAHRLVARAGLEPTMCRVDYVSLGEERKVAEVQWKSGGLGLFFGIQDVYCKVIPGEGSLRPLGHLVDNFLDLVCHVSDKPDAVAVNCVTYVWYKSEHYLRGLAERTGVSYFPVHRDDLPGRMVERGGRYFLSQGKHLYPIDYLYGREFGSTFRRGLLRLVSATLDGRVWVETPLNYLYRQKWGLALPFMPEFKGLFNDRLRRIIIPTALLEGTRVDLSPLVPYLTVPERERLMDVRSLEDIAELPTSLRRSLVFKCGAGRGGFHSHGKGVFRISGSRSSAKRTLEFIKDRVASYNEPWVVQEYIDRTQNIHVSLPGAVGALRPLRAHARFMIFGRLKAGTAKVMGGLGNYGRHWKVSGRSPGIDDRGHVMGTAFNDIRVRLDYTNAP